MREHTLRWRCTSKSHGTIAFATENEYVDHMRASHQSSFTEPQLRVLASRQGRPVGAMFEICPICGTDNLPSGSGSLEHHIIGHLRFLALKSLPAYEDDDSNPQSNDGRSEASQPETRSTIQNDSERHQRPDFDDNYFDSIWGIDTQSPTWYSEKPSRLCKTESCLAIENAPKLWASDAMFYDHLKSEHKLESGSLLQKPDRYHLWR